MAGKKKVTPPKPPSVQLKIPAGRKLDELRVRAALDDEFVRRVSRALARGSRTVALNHKEVGGGGNPLGKPAVVKPPKTPKPRKPGN
jgi:hypothetical protein